jgi:hypothetical protein
MEKVDITLSLKEDSWLYLLELVRQHSVGNAPIAKIAAELSIKMEKKGLDTLGWWKVKKEYYGKQTDRSAD